VIGVQESTRYFSAIHCALVLTSKEVGARQLTKQTKQMDRSAARSCTSPLPSRPLHLHSYLSFPFHLTFFLYIQPIVFELATSRPVSTRPVYRTAQTGTELFSLAGRHAHDMDVFLMMSITASVQLYHLLYTTLSKKSR
jgi:hypothetical protein